VPVLWQARQDADTIKAVASRNSDSIAAAKQFTSGQKPGAGFSFDRSGGAGCTENSEQRDSHRERGNALFKVIAPNIAWLNCTADGGEAPAAMHSCSAALASRCWGCTSAMVCKPGLQHAGWQV
jgi:hypothetical protein